jgi:transcriptional regulator
MSHKSDYADKADRALELSEQGLVRAQIAERLGVPPSNVPGMIQRAKQRRAKRKMRLTPPLILRPNCSSGAGKCSASKPAG